MTSQPTQFQTNEEPAMETPEWPELPECPVCLQSYDGVCTTPRVLGCGHSACETCLTQLPNPFPHTIRCPACIQIVKFPHPQGPLALPKNIDLLRLSSHLQQNSNPNSNISAEPRKPNKQIASQVEQQFIPNLWTREFYSNWKNWILPQNSVLAESSGSDDGCCYGKTVNFEGLSSSPIACMWKENQKVSLVKVGLFLNDNDSKLKYSYVAKVVRVLCDMRDGERSELGFILRASLKQPRICKVYGIWYYEDDHGVYLVCERYSSSLSQKLGGLENGCVGKDEENMNFKSSDDKLGFAMTGMEICEAVMGLHSEGLVFGCLGLSCYNFDDFGHACIDINEVLVTGWRFRKTVVKALSIKPENVCKELEVSLLNNSLDTLAFVSPELFYEILQKEGIDVGSSIKKYASGYGSDVWSLSCVLIWLLIGKPFLEEMHYYLCYLVPSLGDKDSLTCGGMYMGWFEKVRNLLETKLGSEFFNVKEQLFKCLDFDPGRRPVLTDIWKCLREIIIKPKFDIMVDFGQLVIKENTVHCLVQGELCQSLKDNNEVLKGQMPGLQEKDENGREDVDQVGTLVIDRDLIEGLSEGHVKCMNLKGHLDCITGLAVGGGFLFSSSFDKTVCVWSLEDFTHVHSFKGHEHKVMAIVFVDEEQPLCISGDSGGGICIWGISIPFGEEPQKKLYEEKDWRYSGIHALAISGTGYFYSGNGDKSIKAWSMQNYTLSCTLTGHKSVVSSLAVCNGVLYSGSWDGTIRLWSISDHSPLTVLEENLPGNVASVLSVAADQRVLVAAHENGHIKMWRDNVLLKSTAAQVGAIFSISMEGKWIFTGGWSKTVYVQELSGDDSQIDTFQIGSIPCDSVLTALLYWQGKLFVGQADRVIKVYYYGV